MSKTINQKVYREAVAIYRKLYKSKPLDEKVIRTIMKRIELKGKKKVRNISEALDSFLKRGSKMTVSQLLKEFEVDDDYDPSESSVPSFEGQVLDTPFEGDNDANADYVSDEVEPDAPNPDVDSGASSELIAEKRKAKLRRKENYFKRYADDGFIEEDTDVSDVINGDYVDYEDDILIDGEDFAEGEEDIYFDNPVNDDVVAEKFDYAEEFEDELFDEDELFPEDEYEDFIITEEDDFLFEDDEVEDEGENEVIAEAKKSKKTKKVEADDDKEDDKEEKDDDEKEDAKKDDDEKEDKEDAKKEEKKSKK